MKLSCCFVPVHSIDSFGAAQVVTLFASDSKLHFSPDESRTECNWRSAPMTPSILFKSHPPPQKKNEITPKQKRKKKRRKSEKIPRIARPGGGGGGRILKPVHQESLRIPRNQLTRRRDNQYHSDFIINRY